MAAPEGRRRACSSMSAPASCGVITCWCSAHRGRFWSWAMVRGPSCCAVSPARRRRAMAIRSSPAATASPGRSRAASSPRRGAPEFPARSSDKGPHPAAPRHRRGAGQGGLRSRRTARRTRPMDERGRGCWQGGPRRRRGRRCGRGRDAGPIGSGMGVRRRRRTAVAARPRRAGGALFPGGSFPRHLLLRHQPHIQDAGCPPRPAGHHLGIRSRHRRSDAVARRRDFARRPEPIRPAPRRSGPRRRALRRGQYRLRSSGAFRCRVGRPRRRGLRAGAQPLSRDRYRPERAQALSRSFV